MGTDAAVFLFRGDARGADALDAVGAFLHDATRTHRDFGIVHRLEIRRVVIAVLEKIEPTDLVGTVVRTKPRADAAVVHLEIQSLAVVHRRRDRANQFARRVLAMHARHRHVVEPGTVERTFVIGVDPDPEHLPIACDLVLADGGDVVFRFAGDEAGVAADARGQVDRHRPLVAAVRIFVGVVKRPAVCGLLHRFGYEVGIGNKLPQRAGAVNLALFAVDALMRLRRDEWMPRAGLRDRYAAGDPQ